jgi:hypothetical protein
LITFFYNLEYWTYNYILQVVTVITHIRNTKPTIMLKMMAQLHETTSSDL